MKMLEKHLLAKVAGGTADEVVFNDATGGGFGGDFGNDGGDGDMFGAGGSSNDLFASVGAGPSVGGFDANGVGANSCVAMPPAAAAGLFGLSLIETLAVGTAGLTVGAAVAGGIGGGIGASAAIEAAGGFGAMGTMGAAASGVGTSMGLGLLAAGVAGVAVGAGIYYVAGDAISDGAPAATSGFIDGFLGTNDGRVGMPATRWKSE